MKGDTVDHLPERAALAEAIEWAVVAANLAAVAQVDSRRANEDVIARAQELVTAFTADVDGAT